MDKERKRRIWLYAPGEQSAYWDRYQHDGIMGIGWDALGDMNRYESREAFHQAMKERIDPDRSFQNDSLCAWQFSHEMEPGDLVIAKKGVGKLLGWGIVGSGYRHEPERLHYNNVRDVSWKKAEEKKTDFRLPIKTMTELGEKSELLEKIRTLYPELPA